MRMLACGMLMRACCVCVCVCVLACGLLMLQFLVCALQDLRNVEHMYQFSLTSFIALFSRTLRKPMDAKSIDARISALVRPPSCAPCTFSSVLLLHVPSL